MKLTVVIVNYNVRHFLEHCLLSVREACHNMEVEVVVVDNQSVDDSLDMLAANFPEVRVIANQDNVGFSRANNQAIREAKGEYVLLLNPDTIVAEDTFDHLVAFMDEHPDAGGLGARMVDGKGRFLPESKRGLPTPVVAFYKIFGLSGLFPKSRRFGKYHLGFLDEHEVHQVEILAGAFMLMRKSALDKVGLLDESFFMYGEDIDLSYRIIKGGYNNYYHPGSTIIHYKGESTKKSSVNYVFVFYRAMVIFAKKHFSAQHARLFGLLINSAIWFRAGIALFSRAAVRGFLPALDLITIVAGLFVLKLFYREYSGIIYAEELVNIALPSYGLIWILATFFSGGYDKPVKLSSVATGGLVGTGVILIAYALLPEELRFSRALILLGMLWVLLSTAGLRVLLHLLPVTDFKIGERLNKRIAVVGKADERKRVQDLLSKTMLQPEFVAPVSPTPEAEDKGGFVAGLEQLGEVVSIFRIDEVIYCARDLTYRDIVTNMSNLQSDSLDVKIAPAGANYVIGSNSINTSGELYLMDQKSIGKGSAKRKKRLFDLTIALLLLVGWPVLLLVVQRPLGLLKNIFRVLGGRLSWVGYANFPGQGSLPAIKPGVLSPTDRASGGQSSEMANTLNQLYAREYRVRTDLQIIGAGFRQLGRQPDQ